jgi:hypothetical protein
MQDMCCKCKAVGSQVMLSGPRCTDCDISHRCRHRQSAVLRQPIYIYIYIYIYMYANNIYTNIYIYVYIYIYILYLFFPPHPSCEGPSRARMPSASAVTSGRWSAHRFGSDSGVVGWHSTHATQPGGCLNPSESESDDAPIPAPEIRRHSKQGLAPASEWLAKIVDAN